MTVYWVDPYIECPIGGIHGTTDTSSRSGTYSAPYALSDIKGTSTGDTSNVIRLMSDGDEIRLKGQAISSYLIDAGTFYFSGQTLYRKTGETAPSAWSTMRSNKKTYTGRTNDCHLILYDKTFTDSMSIPDTDGNKPYWFVQAYDANNDDRFTTHSYQNGLQYNMLSFVSPYNSSTNTNFNIKVVDYQYYFDDNTYWNSGNWYLGCYNNVGVKITDGWDSETTRNGYTIICFQFTNMNSWRYLYFNTGGNSSTGPDTLYDLPNTTIAAIYSSSNSYPYMYMYLYSALGGYYSGNRYTQRFGGLVKTDPGWPNYNYVTYYYYTGVSSSADSATNNNEVNYATGYYGLYTYRNGNYGNTTLRLNNIIAHTGQRFQQWSGSNDSDISVGTIMSYSDRVMYASSVASNTIKFLDSAYIGVYSGSKDFITSNSTLPEFRFLGDLWGPVNKSERFNTNSGPTSGSTISTIIAGNYEDVSLSAANWYDNKNIFFDGRSSTPHYLTEGNMALGQLKCDGNDYRTTNPGFKVRSDMYLYTNSNLYTGDVNIHFSTNDYDNIPVGAALSTNFNNVNHTPMLYYNESDGALCFIIPDTTGAFTYVKNVEIPCNAYAAGNTLSVVANIKTSTSWSGTYGMNVLKIDGNGSFAYGNVSASSTTSNYDLTYTTTDLGTQNSKHMIVKIYIIPQTGRGPSGTNDMIWFNSITATVT